MKNSNDALHLLMQSLGAQVLEGRNDPSGSVAILMSETLKFRDKLKRETGTVLTVDDVRVSLTALENLLTGGVIQGQLTDEQRLLAQIWHDRLTLFRS